MARTQKTDPLRVQIADIPLGRNGKPKYEWSAYKPQRFSRWDCERDDRTKANRATRRRDRLALRRLADEFDDAIPIGRVLPA